MVGHLLTWWGLGPTRPTRRYATVHYFYLTMIIGVPLYEVVKKCCPNYNPSMLKRMGFGLFCCLIKEAVAIIIQATMNRNGSCEHFDNNTMDSCYFLTMHLNINGTCPGGSSVENFRPQPDFSDSPITNQPTTSYCVL